VAADAPQHAPARLRDRVAQDDARALGPADRRHGDQEARGEPGEIGRDTLAAMNDELPAIPEEAGDRPLDAEWIVDVVAIPLDRQELDNSLAHSVPPGGAGGGQRPSGRATSSRYERMERRSASAASRQRVGGGRPPRARSTSRRMRAGTGGSTGTPRCSSKL